MTQHLATPEAPSALASLARQYNMDKRAFESTLRNTIMPARVEVSNEQLAAFAVVANRYGLNPFTKEIYAFPAKGGGIQPIVSIDGWLKIINEHPQFDGMEFEDQFDGDRLAAVTCIIYRKDRNHAVRVTEYLSECIRATEPWSKWPARMLRHKAAIQAARYAFGFAGIADPDEAERMASVGAVEMTEPPERPQYTAERFAELLPKWRDVIESGKRSVDDVIVTVQSKAALSDEQVAALRDLAPAEVIEAEVADEDA